MLSFRGLRVLQRSVRQHILLSAPAQTRVFSGETRHVFWDGESSRCIMRIRTKSSIRPVNPSNDRRVSVRHILCETRERLDEVAVQLESGEDFSELAKKYSECPSKSNGGKVGWVIRGMASSAIEDAVLHKPVGSVVTVESEGGWHLIEILQESQPQQTEGEQSQRPRARVQSVSVTELAEVLGDPSKVETCQFIDVREPWEFDHAKIKLFELYPLSKLSEWMPTIADDLDPERETYVLCHHGMRSLQASSMLTAQGFQNVYNISGGIASYSALVDNSVPQY